ncbi:unnamed protein product, partial [Phaeothamnion confervicola]
LHDTVLQTLALVDRRAGSSDPELAATARQADRDLRAFLFADPTASGETSLRARIQSQVERASAGSDLRVVVNVLDDGCCVAHRTQDALARAIGESVANALEHGAPTNVVVFAETLSADEVFASVRDDGRGFDADVNAFGVGIRESIIARMHDVGGAASIVSAPGSGTEVKLWTREPQAT